MSSAASLDSNSKTDREYAKLLSNNRELAMKLPPAGDTYALAECNLDRSELQRLSRIGAIERVGREEQTTPSGNEYTRWRWQTVPRAQAWVEYYFDDVPECPGEHCHSTGVRCLKAGERYSCTNENCTETFGSEKAKELIHR